MRLAGPLEDTAYEQQQFLVEREGAFVQLTPLLYKALEQVDGKRSFAEIAQGISKAMGRPFEPRNAQRLLEKLVPLGLVLDGDGKAAPPPQGASALRSPLAINLRMALIPSDVANAIATPFAILFFPLIAAVAVLAWIAAHVWIYMSHGVAQAASQVINSPGLILALMGMFVVAAAFHELGHAAGLRYGGGKVRAMGAGLYLVYPVFYTDITASYGLERPARLRADLGGFYFNALFQLALIGLYFVTGLEFLLMVVMLIDIEILYQLLPFVRMDGYWILADLTGIPDFFSRMGQTLRRLFPGAPQKKLPPLNHTARVVFALYMLIVLPVLALLLFAAFRSFPSVAATAYASGSKLLTEAGDAKSHGDMVAAASDLVQVILLALQALGLALVIIQVLRRALGALWGWAKPSAGRKGIASLATVATAALLVALWMPSVPATGNKPGPLYGAVTQATPIPPEVRGTIGEAVPFVPVLPAAPGASPTTAPQASASVAPSASSAPSPSESATPVPTPTATPVPSASPAPSSTP